MSEKFTIKHTLYPVQTHKFNIYYEKGELIIATLLKITRQHVTLAVNVGEKVSQPTHYKTL